MPKQQNRIVYTQSRHVRFISDYRMDFFVFFFSFFITQFTTNFWYRQGARPPHQHGIVSNLPLNLKIIVVAWCSDDLFYIFIFYLLLIRHFGDVLQPNSYSWIRARKPKLVDDLFLFFLFCLFEIIIFFLCGPVKYFGSPPLLKFKNSHKLHNSLLLENRTNRTFRWTLRTLTTVKFGQVDTCNTDKFGSKLSFFFSHKTRRF